MSFTSAALSCTAVKCAERVSSHMLICLDEQYILDGYLFMTILSQGAYRSVLPRHRGRSSKPWSAPDLQSL